MPCIEKLTLYRQKYRKTELQTDRQKDRVNCRGASLFKKIRTLWNYVKMNMHSKKTHRKKDSKWDFIPVTGFSYIYFFLMRGFFASSFTKKSRQVFVEKFKILHKSINPTLLELDSTLLTPSFLWVGQGWNRQGGFNRQNTILTIINHILLRLIFLLLWFQLT